MIDHRLDTILDTQLDILRVFSIQVTGKERVEDVEFDGLA